MPDSTCAVDTCDRDAHAAGLCRGHYKRLRKHGDVRADVPLREFTPGAACGVRGCGRLAHARGLCPGHYKRLRDLGDVCAAQPLQEQRHMPRTATAESGAQMTREERLTASLHARVRAGLVESTETWNGTPHLLWTRATAQGYGVVRDGLRGNQVGVHRVAWEMERGPIPDGLTIDHLCRTPLCANVLHLEPVTLPENVRRAHEAAARTHCKRGHEFTVENTRVYAGTRYCRACKRERRAAEAALRDHGAGV